MKSNGDPPANAKSLIPADFAPVNIPISSKSMITSSHSGNIAHRFSQEAPEGISSGTVISYERGLNASKI